MTGNAKVWSQTVPGPLLDVAAPATDTLVVTLGASGDNAYGNAAGTSFAAPHVSGTAALMLSAYNKGIPLSRDRLRPEDVEHVLEATSRDVAPSGWDMYTGKGLINASAAVAGVTYEKGYGNFIVHVSVSANPSGIAAGTVTVQPYGGPTNYYIEGGKQYTGSVPVGSASVKPGVYYAQAYKVTLRGPSYLGNPDYYLSGAWGLNGSVGASATVPTTFYGPPVPFSDFPSRTSQLVTAEPGVEADPTTASKRGITVVGYVYDLIQYYPLQGNPAGGTAYTIAAGADANFTRQWIPFDPNTNSTGSIRQMSYSLWLHNLKTVASFRAVNPGDDGSSLGDATTASVAYPNPAASQVTLRYPSSDDENTLVELTTAAGKSVRTEKVTNRHSSTVSEASLDLDGLPTGVYFYRIVTGKQVFRGRFAKGE